MGRVVIVSNRVVIPKEGASPAGGLSVGVLGALRELGGVWFGCSGRITHEASTQGPEITEHHNVTYATIRLNRDDHDGYYNGFSNSILWPLFHYMLGYYNYDRSQYDAYERVNRSFADKLLPLLEQDDTIWVHDYHLIPLAKMLRAHGVDWPMGFFLHVPFPSYQMLRVLPVANQMLAYLCQFDLVGFQTRADLNAFRDAAAEGLGATVEDDQVVLEDRSLVTGVFPIGVDVDSIAESARSIERYEYAKRLMNSLAGRKLIMGADRLDYSKGIPERLRSYERLLEAYPQYRGRIVYMQVSAPSRTDIRGYQQLKSEVDELLGGITGQFSEFDWVPIRYIEQSFERDILMAFFRVAQIGIATPLRDGMNLIAKEFVAAQNPEDPGMLVLSNLAGAAKELTDAIVVNPYDPDQVASGIEQGLEMSISERRARHQAMIEVLRKNDIHAWYRRFLDALAESCL